MLLKKTNRSLRNGLADIERRTKGVILGKRYILLVIMLLCGEMLCSCEKNERMLEKSEKNSSEEMVLKDSSECEENEKKQWEKGYELPVDNDERKKAETDCKKIMNLISDIYINAYKGSASNVVISDLTINRMVEKVKETGCPVNTTKAYSNMENYKRLEDFLNDSLAGKHGSLVIYEIHSDGGVGRKKYFFDGTDMYVLSAKVSWNDNGKPVMIYIVYNRLKEWKYTEKGWFCYKMCVPEPPEVSETVDGSCLIRVKPMSEENRQLSEKYVFGLGYQGNNLLCSNWNIDCMENLDYTGIYEYLYSMKYQEQFHSDSYPNGIPKAEFENLIMEYLPVTAEQIKKCAVFDEETQTYVWVRLGCLNYTPTFFGTAIPEVIDVRENDDGTVILTVDAVCEMVLCDDAVITHELTIRFLKDGSFQYLGNKILNDGIENIPDYQYRICVE